MEYTKTVLRELDNAERKEFESASIKLAGLMLDFSYQLNPGAKERVEVEVGRVLKLMKEVK